MVELEGAHRISHRFRSAWADAGHNRHMFGDDAVECQGRLQAHKGSPLKPVGDQEGMRHHFAPGRGQCVKPSPELNRRPAFTQRENCSRTCPTDTFPANGRAELNTPSSATRVSSDSHFIPFRCH